MKDTLRVTSSFKDPSGNLFYRSGVLYRSVHQSYRENYDLLMASGLYNQLVANNDIISHEEVDLAYEGDCYKIIRPKLIDFVSYPYEWTFDQLRDAALLTLIIQRKSLACQMTLKDASAFNITFYEGSPIFIDTLSFEKNVEGSPWMAYGQFCRHFLAPLLLMKYVDVPLIRELRTNLDGIPLHQISKLLPISTYLSQSILLHIHLHSNLVLKHESSKERVKSFVSTSSKLRLIEHLTKMVASLKLSSRATHTEWSNYQENSNYSANQLEKKFQICEGYLQNLAPKSVWDIGSNSGRISVASAKLGIRTTAIDNDHECIQQLYRRVKGKRLPISLIYMDICNPSNSCGWASKERLSLAERSWPDLIFALALIHHLVISNNIPLHYIAEWFREITQRFLVIEFVPREDTQVQKLLLNRKDVFENYTLINFEDSFSFHFHIRNKNVIGDLGRVIYLMEIK